MSGSSGNSPRPPLWQLRPIPPVTASLALSCLLVSVPLLIWPNLYAFLGWSGPIQGHYWKILTSSFAHGVPGSAVVAPLPHLLGNLAIILTFGLLCERTLGSGRFFILTSATLLTHTIWKCMTVGGNGASGTVWGYLVFAVPLLFWDWRDRKGGVFRDLRFLSLILLFVFALFGVAADLSLRGYGLLNTTNQSHALSILTALPFAVVWLNIMHSNWEKSL